MKAGEVAGLIAAGAAVLAAVALVVALRALVRTLSTVRRSVEDVHGQAMPLLRDLRRTLDRVDAELERVSGVVGRAETIGATVDSGSRLAYLAFSNPLIKAMALGTGAARVARRLRRRRGAEGD